jgi:curved DNA-binding protein
MQNFRNYFEILGVTQDASAEEVKRAYRQLARKYHPDLNPGNKVAEEQFKLLSEAYAVLSDAEKRSQYEDYSSYWRQKGFRQRVASKFSFKNIDFSDLGDFNSFVDQLLNRTGEGSVPSNGRPTSPPASRTDSAYAGVDLGDRLTDRVANASRRDAEASLTVPLERAYSGGQERIRLEDGRAIEVDMPPGMVTGQRIRLRGQGIGGGNLYLRIEVEPHPIFQLVDNDILCRVPITPSEAVLGAVITVPTLDGPVQMTTPVGVQPGRRLRLAGRGYPVGRDRRGDQIVEIELGIPVPLSDLERALYEELRAIEGDDLRTKLLQSWRPVPQ